MKLLASKNGDGDKKPPWSNRIVDPNEVERAERTANGWRAGFFVVCGLLVLSFLVIAFLAATVRTRAVVYFATPGEIKYVGDTNQEYTPTLVQEEGAIGDFITTIRHVPKQDPTLADNDALKIEAMVNSDGYQEWTTGLGTENPKILAQKGYGRDVVGEPDVEQIDPTSFRVTWTERVYQPGQFATPVNISASGVVTLAGQPKLPTQTDVARYNPVGISVKNYDIHAPVLGAQ